MTGRQQVWYWLGGFVVACLLVWLLRGVLLPFIAGMAVAYLLDPLADRLERWRVPRSIAAVVLLVSFFVLVVLLLLLLVPLLQSQIVGLLEYLSGYLGTLRENLQPYLARLSEQLRLSGNDELPKAFGTIASDMAGIVVGLIRRLWQGGLALVGVLSLLFVTPIVAFYLLRDFDIMVARIDGWLPRQHAPTVRRLAREIDDRLAGFLRGQGTVCLVLGSFYAVALSIAGLEFGLIIGLISGLISFIPYVGSAVGLVLSMITAIAQFWPDWVPIAIVLAIFAFGQFVEGNVLTPRLVGDRVGLHPVWVMFALFAGGALAGFVGVLLAVPVAAAAGVLVRFFVEQYLGSPLYDQDRGDRAPP